MEAIIGVILICSLFFMAWYCIKGFNLMTGMGIMATLFTVLALLGNVFIPNSAMEGQSIVDVLTYVYQTGPANWSASILVNIFFGAFFGRVLIETGIASSLIKKTVELGGDKPIITMTLLCIVTAVIFTSMTGAGPVISIGIIVLPILLSLGIPTPIAVFAFMGSIMAGMHANILLFNQFIAMFVSLKPEFASYTFEQNFKFGITCWGIALIIVIIVAGMCLKKSKVSHAWAAVPSSEGANAPAVSWLAVIMPVVGVLAFKLPIILGFLIASIYALAVCGKFKGGFINITRMLQKQFTDGAIDTAPLIGFLLILAMFNNSAVYVAPYFQSLIGRFIPSNPLILCLAFGLLSFLGYFRGPLSLVGCGAAILSIFLGSAANFPVAFLYPLFSCITLTMQHLDITQSWVAWGIGYSKVDTRAFMKIALPTGYAIAIIQCIVVYIMFGGLV